MENTENPIKTSEKSKRKHKQAKKKAGKDW